MTYSCTMLGLCIGLFVSGNETVVESLTLKPTRVEQHQGLLTCVATASSRDGDVARPRDQRHLSLITSCSIRVRRWSTRQRRVESLTNIRTKYIAQKPHFCVFCLHCCIHRYSQRRLVDQAQGISTGRVACPSTWPLPEHLPLNLAWSFTPLTSRHPPEPWMGSEGSLDRQPQRRSVSTRCKGPLAPLRAEPPGWLDTAPGGLIGCLISAYVVRAPVTLPY